MEQFCKGKLIFVFIYFTECVNVATDLWNNVTTLKKIVNTFEG
jgi:hypothetical protein